MLINLFPMMFVVSAINHQSSLITPSRSIAIIGSGAGGSSVAYYLSKLSPSTSVTVFEKSNVVGGRAKYLELNLTICSPVCKPEIVGVELGASIIAKSNSYLVEAAKEFGLEYEDRSSAVDLPELGIWNGNEFLVYLTDSWLSKLKLAWRYGISLFKAPNICKDLVKRFLRIYADLENRMPWLNHEDEIDSLNVRDTLSVDCKQYFIAKGVSENYIEEFLGGIVRNIYLTDVDQIHAFACNVGLFASVDDVFKIRGGNKLLYENMLYDADVVLKSTVESIAKVENGIELSFEFEGRQFSRIFDHVVIATPELSKINFKGIDWKPYPQFEYVKLYVTVVYGVVNPLYFGLETIHQVPLNILTPKGHSPFNCFATTLLNATHSVSKLFSKLPLSVELLDNLFSNRIITHTQSWDSPGSYPLLSPTSDWDLLIGQDNVYYVNAMERWVSTMETETIAGKNIALNIVQNLGQTME